METAAKILVVDDDRTVRITLEGLLVDKGYQVVTVSNTEEALQLTGQSYFDIIFTDIHLGKDNGLELLKQLKSRDPYCPVILITGYPNLDTATEGLRSGAFDYISKPVTQVELVRVVQLALQHRKLAEENRNIRNNLEAIFRSVQDGIITVGRSFQLLAVNESVTDRLCGIIRRQLGQDIKTLNLKCSMKCLSTLEKTLAEGVVSQVESLTCLSSRNTEQVVTITTTPLKDSRDKFVGAVMVVRDRSRIELLERDLKARRRFHGMIGSSSKMQAIYGQIEDIKDLPVTVLITGESGTGKELIVDALHHLGDRCKKPFIKLNCAALPENLLESELFGHVKGAFTGAIRDQPGRFERAHGGTIFLDEIGDISPALQVRLLRVLQEREVERVGGQESISIDVRVVSATNADLQAKVKTGEFREDLYYRLKVMEIQLPPLRDRREDILELIDFFLEKFEKIYQKHVVSVDRQVESLLLRHPWPGNIRQLQHTIEHAFVLCRETVIKVDNLPADFVQNAHSLVPPSVVNKPMAHSDESEKGKILEALTKAGGNKAKAARLLNIDRSTLYRKIDRYRLELDDD